ncbi:MAG: prepilin-type N-terminal cleavage/methylation domain-containing protein [Verrucomicrobia bacterium]|nr:prepilin-type N-terminal cleavage/methylation domain-containing protein [Verrucomicrobiota bacterium]
MSASKSLVTDRTGRDSAWMRFHRPLFPSPWPSPQREGKVVCALGQAGNLGLFRASDTFFLLPKGEGRGEGEGTASLDQRGRHSSSGVGARNPCQSGRQAAFTLPEMMIASSILALVLAGVLASHLFGVRLIEITKAKLGASDEARRALSKLAGEVRSAKMIKIGDGNSSGFSEVADGLAQKGSALQIYPSTNTAVFVRYFLDGDSQRLMRVTGDDQSSSVVANCITNSQIFTSEDYAGNILTNNQNNRVIGLMLQFYQIQYPVIQIGPGNYYDYYQLRTRVTRRALE